MSGWKKNLENMDNIVGRYKEAESTYVKRHQYFEEDLLVWKRDQRGTRGNKSVSLTPTGII